MDIEYEIRTPEHGIMMCSARVGENGEIIIIKKAGNKREEIPLDRLMVYVAETVHSEKLKAQHLT